MPFASQSLDLVVLPHVLEFAEEPHQVLREVDRVLTDQLSEFADADMLFTAGNEGAAGALAHADIASNVIRRNGLGAPAT